MAEPVLEVRGLAKAFGALRATDDVSLTLQAGEIHALIGPNGAGKSTLIRLITGELAPDTGEIRFEGERIDALDAAARARAGLARSFQVSALAPELTALQNVMLAVLAREGGAFGFFRRALGEARLTGPAAEHLAEAGLGARAGTRAADLSHGERRRLEIAIALALRPRVFLLDEPMAGIGHDGAAEITALLARLRARAPILLVEHDMDAVFTLADRITVLVAGRVIATGTVAEIRADRQVQRAYLGEEA